MEEGGGSSRAELVKRAAAPPQTEVTHALNFSCGFLQYSSPDGIDRNSLER